MEQFLAEHFDAIVTLILGFLGGFAFVKVSTKKKDSNEANQYKNIDTGGGDFAGRDITKNNNKNV